MTAAAPEAATELRPLAGLRVIEFSQMVMGPSCGLILADLGADVIKVEPPQGRPHPLFQGPGCRLLRHLQPQQAQHRAGYVDRGRPDHRAAADREQRRPDREFPTRPAEADRSRLRVGCRFCAAPDLLLAQGLFARPVRESPRARRGRADDGRPCLHDGPAGPADARRCLGQRHHGRHVRRDRDPGRAGRAAAHRPRSLHPERALREQRVPDGAGHDVRGGQRPALDPLFDQGQPLAGLRSLRHQGRLEAVRHHRR